MKKSLIALAALATVATAAQAQSSVTMYGILDAGVSYNGNANASAQNTQAFANGILNTSRWGMRGTEDLGGGLKANFVLESGLTVGTGAQSRSNALFDRRAIVGLQGAWGKLDLGRNTNVGYDYAAEGITDPLALAYDGYTSTIVSTKAYGANQKINPVNTVLGNTTLGTTRNDGTIKYTYTASAFEVAGAYKPGGVAGGGAENSAYSVGGKASFGPVKAAYSHLQITDASNRRLKYDSFGASAAATSQLTFTAGYHELKADANYGATADCTYAATGSAVITVASGKSCSAPNLTTEAFVGAPGTDATTAGKLKVTTVGASYLVTPAYTLTAVYNQAKVSGAQTGTVDNYILQNEYSFTKRTKAYATYAYSKAKDQGLSASFTSNNADVVIVGINHKF